MMFIATYSPALGSEVATIAWASGTAGVLAALFGHYVHPVPLGALLRLRPFALATYCGCVVGELALIAVGSRALTAAHSSGLRPALITAVLGLHFLPLARAFHERMFLHLGGAVTILGVVGMLTGAFRIAHAVDALTVVAGLVMITIITLYAHGRFTPTSSSNP